VSLGVLVRHVRVALCVCLSSIIQIKTGLYPINYNNEGWQNAYDTFGKLNELLKRQRRETGETILEISWVVKPIPIHRQEPLTKAEVSLIKSFVTDDDFLSATSETNSPRPPMEIPLIFIAQAIAEDLLGDYTHNASRDITRPPLP